MRHQVKSARLARRKEWNYMEERTLPGSLAKDCFRNDPTV